MMSLARFVWHDPLLRVLAYIALAVAAYFAMPMMPTPLVLPTIIAFVLGLIGAGQGAVEHQFGWRMKEPDEMTEEEKDEQSELSVW